MAIVDMAAKLTGDEETHLHHYAFQRWYTPLPMLHVGYWYPKLQILHANTTPIPVCGNVNGSFHECIRS